MSDYWTANEVYDKCEWEGGLYETVTSWGMSNVVDPEKHPDLYEALGEYIREANKLADLDQEIDFLLEEAMARENEEETNI